MVTTTISEETINKMENKWVSIARELGPGFASQAARHDAEGSFVAENYELMRQHKLFSARVPEELAYYIKGLLFSLLFVFFMPASAERIKDGFKLFLETAQEDNVKFIIFQRSTVNKALEDLVNSDWDDIGIQIESSAEVGLR